MYGYGVNPYYQQQRFGGQQSIEQPIQPNTMQVQTQQFQSRPVLNGKQVESIDVVKAMDIPLDGSVSYFPIADGSAIVTKQLGLDGISKTIIYKPVEENKGNKFVTFEEFEKSMKRINIDEIDDLKEEIKELKIEIKEMKKKKKED